MAQEQDTNEGGWTYKKKAKQLTHLYYAAGDPGSYGGVDRLYARAKDVGIPVSRDEVQNYLTKQLPYSIHKPVRHKFSRNHTYASNIDQQWQADLADMQGLSSENGGNNYILTCIDVLSRFAWAVPVRSKSTNHMVMAFKKLFQIARPRVPQRLQTDKGKEFFNKDVSKLLSDKGIHHFASNSDTKAAVVERFNRTLKTRLWVYFSAHDTKRYVNILQDMVYAYNHSVHRILKMRPTDVEGEAAANKAWINLYYKDSCLRSKKTPLTEGERTRISRWKGEFEKGYVPNWTREHFIVDKRLEHPRTVYKLKDARNEAVEGNFYESELQALPSVTLQVERVIRQRKRGTNKEVLVKWRGFSDKFNRWIPSGDLQKYKRSPADRAEDVYQ
jgi:transposase InsO family protein